MQIETNEMLEKLGYSNDWIKYGFLSLQELNEQYSKYINNDDKNLEHYRYNTIKNWINCKQSLSQEELDNFLYIYNSDQDRVMMESTLILLIHKNILSSEQLDFIEKNYDTNIKKEIFKQKAREKIRYNQIDKELIDKIINEKNYSLLREIVDSAENMQLLHYILNKKVNSKKINNILKNKVKKIN